MPASTAMRVSVGSTAPHVDDVGRDQPFRPARGLATPGSCRRPPTRESTRHRRAIPTTRRENLATPATFRRAARSGRSQ